jgi:hypothetical protein
MQKIDVLKDTIAIDGNNKRLNIEGMTVAAINITGTFVATVVFEYTINGSDWYSLSAKVIGDNIFESGATAAGKWIADVAGFSSIRVRCTAFTSGEIEIFMRGISNGSNSGVFAGGNGAPITAATANTPAIATSTSALAANANRKGWMIQNVGTNPLFVNLGGTASASVYHAVLKAGSADNDGLGSSFSQMDGVIFTGAVTIAGTSPKYVVLEL